MLSSTSLRTTRRTGAAVVEFACVVPLLFMIILGMIEFGRALMVQQILCNAAREGARSAVLPGSSVSSVRTVVNSSLANTSVTLSNPSSQITVSPDPSSAAPGTPISVSINVPYSSVSWLPSAQFLQGKTLSATVVMRMEASSY